MGDNASNVGMPGQGKPNTAARNFRLEEYKSLREEIQKRTDRQVNLETYIILALAVVYGFLVTTPEQNLPKDIAPLLRLLWWIPVVLLFTGLFRWRSNHRMIVRIATYLRGKHEPFVSGIDPTYLGWETYQQQNQKGGDDRTTVVLIWIVFILVASVVAAVQTFHLLGTKP
jgi:hypothetical protein